MRITVKLLELTKLSEYFVSLLASAKIFYFCFKLKITDFVEIVIINSNSEKSTTIIVEEAKRKKKIVTPMIS